MCQLKKCHKMGCKINNHTIIIRTLQQLLNNETLLEQLYDEAWIDYAIEHNLTQDQLTAIEQDSEYGILPEIEAEARRRFEDLIQ